MIRIDMSEFMEQHSAARLIGSPPGYVGYGEGGELTEAVKNSPYSIVLFDEIEKAHVRVLDLLLQIFDDGRLTDGKGRLVDFRNTLIILTSNLSIDTAEDPEVALDQDVRSSLTRHLRPELINRIDEVVVFHRLGRLHFEELLVRLEGDLNDRVRDRAFRISIGPRLREHLLVQVAGSPFGGRALRRVFETQVIDRLSDRLLGAPEAAVGAWTLDLNPELEPVWYPDQRQHYFLPPAASGQ